MREVRRALGQLDAELNRLSGEEAAVRKAQAELQQEREKYNKAKQK